MARYLLASLPEVCKTFTGNRVTGKSLVVLIVVAVSAACALNVASSKLSSVDRAPGPEFPKRVGVATIIGNLAAGQGATDRLSRGLVDLGFKVVGNNWDIDRILGDWAAGVDESIPEVTRVALQAQYGLEGIFVGILSQDKGNLLDETRLYLKLMSLPTGRLVWSVNIHGGGVTNLHGGVQHTAVSAVEKALRSLEKDLYTDPPPSKKAASPSRKVSQLQISHSE